MGERAKVLIIDDDKDLIKTYTLVLSDKYDVDMANDGAEAIKKSKENYFNVALIDIVLPDMSGIELLTKLRRGTPRLRKVMITGHATVENAINALNLGADAFLIKPIAPETILKAISDQLVGQQREIKLIQEKVDEYVNAKDYEEKGNILADVFNNVDFGVEVWIQKKADSDEFHLIFSNPAAEELTGISQKEKKEKRVEEVYSMHPMRDFPKVLMKVMQTGKIKRVPIYSNMEISQKKNLMQIVPLRKRFIAIILEDMEKIKIEQE